MAGVTQNRAELYHKYLKSHIFHTTLKVPFSVPAGASVLRAEGRFTMAGGHVAVAGVTQDRAELYHNRLTVICFIYCLLISWAGGLFGLDLDKSLSLMSACVTFTSVTLTWHPSLKYVHPLQLQPCRQKLISCNRLCHACSQSFPGTMTILEVTLHSCDCA